MADANAITLNINGDALPVIGLGTWNLEKADSEKTVYEAIKLGYRHIDCAALYGNEVEVGNGIAAAIAEGLCTRKDLWITSKLWNTYHHAKDVEPAIRRTLSDLKLDYLDLYLMHFPLAIEVHGDIYPPPPNWLADPNAATPKMIVAKVPIHETWKAMEELVRKGLTKYLGISNFNCQSINDLLSYAEVHPVINQIEHHPQLVQANLVRYCLEQNIYITAYSPFGGVAYKNLGGNRFPDYNLLEHKLVKAIAAKCNKTPAQVLLSWSVQHTPGISVIAKSSSKDRLKSNLDAASFKLPIEDVKALTALDNNQRYNDMSFYGNEFFNNFCPLFD